MANPSPAAVAAIRDRVSDWTRADAAILADLNAATVDNPTPARQVRKPLTVAGMMAKVDPTNRAKIYARPAVGPFSESIARGDLGGALNWLTLARDAGDLAEGEYEAILADAQATVPDPAHRGKLSWAETTIGRVLDLQDIQAARPL